MIYIIAILYILGAAATIIPAIKAGDKPTAPSTILIAIIWPLIIIVELGYIIIHGKLSDLEQEEEDDE